MAQINESDIKTPGVYVNEIPSFPPSIAQVATAVPAFIGYTEFAEQNGHDLTMVPTRISSILEYVTYFGGMHELKPSDITVTIDMANNNAVKEVTVSKQFYLYDSIRSFYDNGGGNCYVVSVGNYTATVVPGDENKSSSPGLRNGVKAVEKYDEPTILLFPDAVLLEENNFYALQQMALKQCADLGDRVCILDLKENDATKTDASRWNSAVEEFRNKIGINNLNYGNAYTPWLITATSRQIPFAVINGHVLDTAPPANKIKLESLSANPAMNDLVLNAITADADATVVSKMGKTSNDPNATIEDQRNELRSALLGTNKDEEIQKAAKDFMKFIQETINGILGLKTDIKNPKFGEDLIVLGKAESTGLLEYMTDFAALCNNDNVKNAIGFGPLEYKHATWLTESKVEDTKSDGIDYPKTPTGIKEPMLSKLTEIMNGIVKIVNSLQNSAEQYNRIAEQVLYQSHPVINNIVSKIQQKLSALPPSGTVAGVYVAVDGTRGVWKAPANVSLNGIVAPTQMIDDNLQKDLNIDVDAGKSINAIRAFTGKGILVWGARTLDGNSNDWRYISVRRFYIMVEESVKKATMQFVFEPNDANTWVRVRAMIENYLTNLWRLGALAGAKPEHAFYVKVGLGQTMTFDDILNGKMIVEIGMAPVRPAEFIILRFSQIQQQS